MVGPTWKRPHGGAKVAISDANDGAAPEESQLRRTWFKFDWRSHWHVYLVSLASLVMLAGFGIMELGARLENQAIIITGAAVLLSAFLIWVAVGATIAALLSWSLTRWLPGHRKHT